MNANAQRHPSQTLIIVLAFVAFISLGLPDGLFGRALPSIRDYFGITAAQVGLVFVTGTTGYFLSSVASGTLMGRLGVGRLLALSCALTSTALIGYTLAPGWWGVVLLGLLLGAGAGAIDTGLNTYVAANHGEGLMQWLHASFGVGTTIGPLIMGTVLERGLSWQYGYLIIVVAQAALAATFFLTASQWQSNPAAPKADILTYKTPARESLALTATWMSVGIFFLYVGLEAGTGAWCYTMFTEARGISTGTAGLWLSIYWGSFTLGRISAGVIAGRVTIGLLLRWSMVGAILGAGLLAWNPFPESGGFAVALLGFSLAPIFPALISTTAERVGLRHSSNVIGFQIGAASLGIGILPAAVGLLAEQATLEVIGPFLFGLSLVIFALHEWIRLRHTSTMTNLTNLEIGS